MTIKEYRNNKNLTMKQAAELLEISTRQYNRIEIDIQHTTIKTLKKLVHVFEISDEDIIQIIRDKKCEILIEDPELEGWER